MSASRSDQPDAEPPRNLRESGREAGRDLAAGPGPVGLSVLNAAAVIVAALYFGRGLFVPLVLAALLAFVLAPAASLLQRARIAKAPAVVIVVALAFVVISGIGLVVGRQATSLAASLPSYSDTIQQKVKALAIGGELLGRVNDSIRSLMEGIAGTGAGFGLGGAPTLGNTQTSVAVVPAPTAGLAGGLDASSALLIARTVVEPLFSPLATLGIVVVFVIFVLLSREDLRDRLVRLVGRHDLHRTILAMNDAARRLSRFFMFQLVLNTGLGVFIATGLWYVGLPNPILWGIVAALMRFVPFIGSFIAVVPPFVLALAVAPGWSLAFAVLGLFILADLAMGQIIEPLLYGHSTGLSPIAVILSAAFWAFLWGPIGLLLATPLTVCLVVIGRHVEPLAFLEVMLGDSPPLEPPETFYQRALEGNAKELAVQARKVIAATSLAEYYDRVAMQGLALAQADLSRDALAFERLDAIHRQIEALLAGLARTAPQHGPAHQPPPAEWQADDAVLCIPGRGQLDDLAAAMAMQVLRGAGFGGRVESNSVLGPGRTGQAYLSSVRLCCLSVLEQGSSPSGIRYLLRRIERQMPNAAIVVCLWHAERSSPMLGALRSEGNEETIILSIGELTALARAIATRAARPAIEPVQPDAVV